MARPSDSPIRELNACSPTQLSSNGTWIGPWVAHSLREGSRFGKKKKEKATKLWWLKLLRKGKQPRPLPKGAADNPNSRIAVGALIHVKDALKGASLE